jgi:hypothetical protein
MAGALPPLPRAARPRLSPGEPLRRVGFSLWQQQGIRLDSALAAPIVTAQARVAATGSGPAWNRIAATGIDRLLREAGARRRWRSRAA